jgi:hypothetical protein
MTNSLHICPECGWGYSIKSQLDHHVNEAHAQKCKHREDGMISCSTCDSKTWEDIENNRMGYDDFKGKQS